MLLNVYSCNMKNWQQDHEGTHSIRKMNRRDGVWMYERRMVRGGLYPNFGSGVNKFLDFVLCHAQWETEQKIYCHCDKCTNRYIFTRDEVLHHLYYNRFMKNYYVWRLHCEDDNFIQVDNDIPRTSTHGDPGGTLETYL